MTAWLQILLGPFLPTISQVNQLPPLRESDPGDEYHRQMAQAVRARERAEQILNATQKQKSTRPSL